MTGEARKKFSKPRAKKIVLKSVEKFLSEFINLLTVKEKSTFWNELKPVLAQRLIGNFWEVEQRHDVGQDIVLQKCEEFKQDLVHERII